MAEIKGDGPALEVDAKALPHSWPADKDFPLTPVEAWYVMRGYAVKPAKPLPLERFLELPGKLELRDGYVVLRE